jgi:PKD repeat protein
MKTYNLTNIWVLALVVLSICFIPSYSNAQEAGSPLKPVPQQGAAPLAVDFYAIHEGEITEWYWDFGDGKTSTDVLSTVSGEVTQRHTYTAPGQYKVNFMAIGPKRHYIDEKIIFVLGNNKLRILEDGVPLARVRVVAYTADCQTELGGGHYTGRNGEIYIQIENGINYRLQIIRPSDTFLGDIYWTATSYTSPREYTIDIKNIPANAKLTLLDRGRPAPNREVSIHSTGGPEQITYTDEKGAAHFTISPVLHDGTYRFAIGHEPYYTFTKTFTIPEIGEDCYEMTYELNPGSSPINLTTLTVTYLDRPVAKAEVTLHKDKNTPVYDHPTKDTDKNGQVAFDLPIGKQYTFLIHPNIPEVLDFYFVEEFTVPTSIVFDIPRPPVVVQILKGGVPYNGLSYVRAYSPDANTMLAEERTVTNGIAALDIPSSPQFEQTFRLNIGIAGSSHHWTAPAYSSPYPFLIPVDVMNLPCNAALQLLDGGNPAPGAYTVFIQWHNTEDKTFHDLVMDWGGNYPTFTVPPLLGDTHDGQYRFKIHISGGTLVTEPFTVPEMGEGCYKMRYDLNCPPEITSHSPSALSINIREGNSQTFFVTAEDANDDPLTYQWTIDGDSVVQFTETSWRYNSEAGTAGIHFVKCAVIDGVNEPVSVEWKVDVTEVSPSIFISRIGIGDYNSSLDPGEIASFAMDIVMFEDCEHNPVGILTSSDCDILKNELEFKSLDTIFSTIRWRYLTTDTAKFQIKVPDKGETISFTLTLSYNPRENKGEVIDKIEFTLPIRGWPHALNKLKTPTAPLIADLDLDGNLEVIFNIIDYSWRSWLYDFPRGEVCVINEDGSLKWKRTLPSEAGACAVIGDVETSVPGLEVVASSETSIYCMAHDGTLLWEHEFFDGYGYIVGDIYLHKIYDIYIDDIRYDLPGEEILYLYEDFNGNPGTNYIEVLKSKGDHAEVVNRFKLKERACSARALGDLDESHPGKEIVIVDYDDGNLLCISLNGNTLWSFPLDNDWNIKNSVVGDVAPDNPGLEVLIISYEGVSCLSSRADSENNRLLWKYPAEEKVRTEIAVADLYPGEDYPGLETVFVTAGHNVICLSSRGEEIWRAPFNGDSLYVNPVIGDIDGDGELEIVVATGGDWPYGSSYYNRRPKIYCFEANGEQRWKIEAQQAIFPSGRYGCYGVALADFNRDRTLEIVMSSDMGTSFLYCFDDKSIISGSEWNMYIPGAKGGAPYNPMPWPYYRGNSQRTGEYREEKKETN